MLDSWASATNDSASARTSSCSKTTILGELGSLYFSCAIWSVIFCFPVLLLAPYLHNRWYFGIRDRPTVSAGLHGSLYIPNTLHGDAVLVVPVDVLVLQLADFVEQHTQLVGDIRDIFIAGFSPNRKLLLYRTTLADDPRCDYGESTYCNFHSLLCDHLEASHYILFHFN